MSLAGSGPGVSAYSPELANATITNLYDGEKETPDSPVTPPQGRKGSVVNIEKGDVLLRESRNSIDDDDEHALMLSSDDPWDEDESGLKETQQLTFRAIFVGSCLGGVIAASNMYLGLKTGWNFGASLFGAIFGYAIIKTMSKVLPERLGGGYFGPKENVCVQSAATAAGGLGLIFTSGIPAIYQIGLLGAKTPKEDFGRLVTFTFCCAYFGMFFAVPLRKFYILKQKLVFPGAVAAAHTIRSLHVGKNAEANAKKKTKALLIAFCAAITLRVVSEYAPGILWDWHIRFEMTTMVFVGSADDAMISWTLYRLGWKGIIGAESWNWVWEWTPAFTGVGMLVGRHGSYSFVGGTVLAWGIIGPAITAAGLAVIEDISPLYPGYFTVNNMVLTDPINAPSPRYWLIWPGTLVLLAGSFAELGANYKVLWASFKAATEPLVRRYRKVEVNEADLIYDPIPESEQVPFWLWGSGVLISSAASCLVLGLYWKQNVGITIVGIIFAFLFSFIGSESGGRTSIIPVTSIGNASQLVIGGITKAHYSVQSAQLQNCMGGLLALSASYTSVDMLGDLKTTHLLRASPRVQLYAQMIGSLVAIFMSVGMYVLFSTAYPCINDLSLAAHCPFPAPDVSAWRAVAIAVTDPILPIPPSSGYCAIGLAVVAVILCAVRINVVPPKYHWVIPNSVAVGIAFILPATTYPLAMGFGATIAYVWSKKNPETHAMYCYAVAAGFIAGEGLGGIVNAILQIAGVSGAYHGTTVGCPANVYCG